MLGLTPQIIRQVLSDLEFQRAGTKLVFVVDPHEVIDFCFPLGFFEKPSGSPPGANDTVANRQMALYELFYNTSVPRVLLREYAYEVSSLVRFLEWQGDRIYKKLAIVRRLITETSPRREDAREAEAAVVDVVKDELTFALAVSIGLFSFGVERLNHVVDTRLSAEHDNLTKPVRELLSRPPNEDLEKAIVAVLEQATPHPEPSNQLASERRRRSIVTDASVVSKLLAVNVETLTAPRELGLERPLLFLYVSSAERSKTVFGMDTVRRSLPQLGTDRPNILRTWEHFFAYVIHKGDRLDDTIRALRDTERIFVEYGHRWDTARHRPNNQCGSCVLTGGNNTACENHPACSRAMQLNDPIERYRSQEANLKLATNIRDYEHALERANETATRLGSADPVGEYVSLCRQVLRGALTRDLAIERMRVMRDLVEMTLRERDADAVGPGDLHITVAVQRLPPRPRVASMEYAQVLGGILDYATAAFQERDIRRLSLEAAYSHFTDLERHRAGGPVNADHELVRCILYLAFPGQNGDREAYDHAIAMCERFPDAEREFRHVASWAARRLGEYLRAEILAQTSLARFGDDARVYHALALNTFAWVSAAGSESRRTMKNAVDYARRAIDLYRPSAQENKALIAASLHNIAYFQTVNPKDGGFNVAKARAAIEELKGVLPKREWLPRFPEFHHGEALLEYREYELLLRGDTPVSHLCQKLAWAYEELASAMAVQTKPDYVTLKREIADAMSRHGCRAATPSF